MTRRTFLATPAALATTPKEIVVNVASEWSFRSAIRRENPFEEITVDFIVELDGGGQWRVPCFWAGGELWKARFAPPVAGRYHWRSECSDSRDLGLHGPQGSFTAFPYAGSNPLLKHGPVRIAPSGRYFEHQDGTPFFFLADDWWLGLTSRLRFPAELRTLAEDRKRKGFTVVKLTAGLNTDCAEFDPRNANEGGQPWEPGYARIRPDYFDWADKRIEMLVQLGIAPSVVGSWGFYLKSMGVHKMRQHWRYCVARWGAYPVTWYLAMENDLPYYLSTTEKEDTERAQIEWTEVGRYLKKIDPFRRPISMQSWKSGGTAQGGLRDNSILDFDSLHMGHSDRDSAVRCIQEVRVLQSAQPRIPVIPGEVVFEGIGYTNWQSTQRLVFWGAMLNGAAGFCYGANGIWQFNRNGEPFGNSPHGRTWGGDPWDVAMNYPGSAQVGMGKRLLERYEYWKMEPHPEWIVPRPREKENMPPFAAGVPGQFRIIYLLNTFSRDIYVRQLEAGVPYKAYWFDPVSGAESPLGAVISDAAGSWNVPQMPGVWDWVLVLERA